MNSHKTFREKSDLCSPVSVRQKFEMSVALFLRRRRLLGLFRFSLRFAHKNPRESSQFRITRGHPIHIRCSIDPASIAERALLCVNTSGSSRYSAPPFDPGRVFEIPGTPRLPRASRPRDGAIAAQITIARARHGAQSGRRTASSRTSVGPMQRRGTGEVAPKPCQARGVRPSAESATTWGD